MTISVDNAVFHDFKKAAEIIRKGLLERTGKAVPLNELVELLISAELTKRTPEDIARQFFAGIGYSELKEEEENQPTLFQS
ncbi:MAG TPA: hypothetical protein VIS99_12740 [Terrimicrobiaceae bacterium]